MKKLRMDYASITEKLVGAGLRPTRQRLLLGNLLFSRGSRHISAEGLHREAKAANVEVALATVYNTLHQFTDAGLLGEVNVDGGRSYFDTNVDPHHHFQCEGTGELIDIPAEHVNLDRIPQPPSGREVSSVEVMIKLKAPA